MIGDRNEGAAAVRWGGGLLAAGLLMAGVASARAEESGGYHLFNPTPRDEMRPIAGDRPDATESPRTVDAGHIQIETSLVSYGRDDEAAADVETVSVLDDTNLRVGLLADTELQVIASVYERRDTDPADGPETTVEGFGDVTLRLKQNVWGNDGGDTALGVIPFVKVPTETERSNGKVEGGALVTWGWDAGAGWGIGLQAGPAWRYDAADDAYDTTLGHTAVLGFDVVGDLGAFLEYAGELSSDDETDYLAFANTGVTYALDAHTVLDVAAQFGLNEAATDAVVFAGVTWRY